MPRIVYMGESYKGARITKRRNLPKNVVKLGETKSYYRYAQGAQIYLVAKPGVILRWE